MDLFHEKVLKKIFLQFIQFQSYLQFLAITTSRIPNTMGRIGGGSNEISARSTKQLIGALTHVKLPVTLVATESQVREKNLST